MSESSCRSTDEFLPSSRSAGVAIGLGSLLSVAFMAYHPTIEAHGTAAFVEEVTREAVANAMVHGSLIAIIGVLVYGYSCLASRLGLHTVLVRAGLVAYVLGAFATVAAALVSGFIVPEFVSRYQARPPEELETLRQVLALCRTVNHACGRLGVMAMSIAILLWSLFLVRHPGLSRAAGVLGCLAGALPPVALLAGHLPMTVHGFGAFLLAQAVWSLVIASELIRQRI